jgi:putative SOS response-associated peptidase YedK
VVKTDSGKQAFHVHRTDQQMFAFAELWEQWQHETEILYSCTILTTAATELMKPIHDRMPVIIPTDQYHNWLDKTADASQAFALLDNQAYTYMTATPVSDWVNNPRHEDQRCIQAG